VVVVAAQAHNQAQPGFQVVAATTCHNPTTVQMMLVMVAAHWVRVAMPLTLYRPDTAAAAVQAGGLLAMLKTVAQAS